MSATRDFESARRSTRGVSRVQLGEALLDKHIRCFYFIQVMIQLISHHKSHHQSRTGWCTVMKNTSQVL